MPLFSLINLALFQASWFSAALLRDQSILLMLLLLAVHAYLSPSKRADLCVVAVILPVGLIAESLMISTGLMSYQSSWSLPVWMILLWCHLAVSLNHSLAWMKNISVIWQAVLASLAGAGSYAAAANLGALQLLHSQVLSLLIIAAIWAILLPVMMILARHIEQGRLACPAYK